MPALRWCTIIALFGSTVSIMNVSAKKYPMENMKVLEEYTFVASSTLCLAAAVSGPSVKLNSGVLDTDTQTRRTHTTAWKMWANLHAEV